MPIYALSSLGIEPIDGSNWRESFLLEVDHEQMRFVASHSPIVMLGLAKAQVQAEGLIWKPFGIRSGSEMVGFYMLAYGSPEAREVWLRHFFIDTKYQGQGMGARALRLICDQLHANCPEWETLKLSYHAENSVAQRLYEGFGFEPNGETRNGETVLALSL